jgi:hypothetical protein
MDRQHIQKGVTKARQFLLEGKGPKGDMLKYTIDEKHWKELDKIGKIRNIIVHEGMSLHGGYRKPDGNSVPIQSDSGITIYVSIESSLYQYYEEA